MKSCPLRNKIIWMPPAIVLWFSLMGAYFLSSEEARLVEEVAVVSLSPGYGEFTQRIDRATLFRLSWEPREDDSPREVLVEFYTRRWHFQHSEALIFEIFELQGEERKRRAGGQVLEEEESTTFVGSSRSYGFRFDPIGLEAGRYLLKFHLRSSPDSSRSSQTWEVEIVLDEPDA